MGYKDLHGQDEPSCDENQNDELQEPVLDSDFDDSKDEERPGWYHTMLADVFAEEEKTAGSVTDVHDKQDEEPDEASAEKAKKAKRQEKLQPFKYFLCAVSAGVIQFVSALILHTFVLDRFLDKTETIHFIIELNKITFIADTVGLGLSVLWNFTLNRKFTFKDAGNVPIAMALAFLFYVPFYPFQIWYIDTIEKAFLSATGGKLASLAFIVAQGSCMVYNFVLEFLWQKFVVFRKKKNDKSRE